MGVCLETLRFTRDLAPEVLEMTSSNRLGRGVLEPKDCSGRPSAMAAPTFGHPRFREKPAGARQRVPGVRDGS